MLQIRNLRKTTDTIHQALFHHVLNKDQHQQENDLSSITIMIRNQKDRVDQLCAKHGGTAADLATPSFRVYLWLRFMVNPTNLYMHSAGLEDFIHILREIKKYHLIDNSQSLLKINYSGYLYQRKTDRDQTILLVHEAFITAPIKIKRQIVTAAYAKRKGKAVQAVRAYTASGDYISMTAGIRGEPIANQLTCGGNHYDLKQLFSDLNRTYFRASLSQPRLVWSSSRAKRRLGYYHPDIHTIAINKKLDSSATPLTLINYILYHEMLHQHFGIEHRNGRRYAHTSAFHQAEKQFTNYQEAENLIKLL